MKKFILLLSIFVIATSVCKKDNEIAGKCTQCPPNLLLVRGFCYERIRGCLTHAIGPKCTECQFGYVLSQSKCIREAVFLGNNDLNPAPVVPNSDKFLTFEEIEDKLGKKYGSYFSNIHEYFLNKYPQLGKGQIKNVQSIPTKNGVFLSIIYTQDENFYNAEALIDVYNKIKEIAFEKYTQQIRLIDIINKIQKDSKAVLEEFFVYEIQIFIQEFVIDFMNENREFIRFTTKRNKQEAISYQTYTLKFSDLARQKAFNAYPELREFKFNPIIISGFIVLTSKDKTVSVSIEFRNYIFIINRPIYSRLNSGDSLLAGDFTAFKNLKDKRFLASLDYIKRQFPELKNASVLTVQSAIVSGINFLITLFESKTSGRYIIKVFHDYRGITQLIEAHKNDNIILYQLSFDYNRQQIFLNNYLAIAEQSKVFNIPPISSVSKKILQNQIMYRVNYDFEEFLEFKINIKTSKTELLSYYIGGSNLLDTAHPLLERTKRRSPTVLVNFLKSEKPEIIGQKIKSITINQPYYKIQVVVPTGTYQAVIQDKGELYLVNYNRLSEATCFDLSTSHIQSDDVIRAVDSFLKTHYPIEDFKLQNVQTKINENHFIYRYLYANLRLKQIQFFLDESQNQISVSKASILDSGYQLLDDNTDEILYQNILQKLKSQKYGIPFFSEANDVSVRSYFQTVSETIELFMDRKSGELKKSKIWSKKSNKIYPSQFNLNSLVIPQVIGNKYSTQQPSDIKQIISFAQAKYPSIMANSSVKFASKQADKDLVTYIVLIKTIHGYIRFNGYLQTATKSLQIANIVITNYAQDSLQTCQKYNLKGQCLKCPIGEFIYNYSCFKKIQGCLIQPGDTCIKCDSNYIRSNYKCYKQCQLLLS